MLAPERAPVLTRRGVKDVVHQDGVEVERLAEGKTLSEGDLVDGEDKAARVRTPPIGQDGEDNLSLPDISSVSPSTSSRLSRHGI
jgi:hypothetical protein